MVNLEFPFIEEEIYHALMEVDGYKDTGPNGFPSKCLIFLELVKE